MKNKIKEFLNPYLKKGIIDIKAGDTVRIHQEIKIGKQERIQVFEGLVLAKKHGKGISSTITVRKIISGVGVEKTFPLHSPTIKKIEIVKRGKTRRAKLYYLRETKGKKSRLKTKELLGKVVAEKEEPKEEIKANEEEPKQKEETKEQPTKEKVAEEEPKK